MLILYIFTRTFDFKINMTSFQKLKKKIKIVKTKKKYLRVNKMALTSRLFLHVSSAKCNISEQIS